MYKAGLTLLLLLASFWHGKALADQKLILTRVSKGGHVVINDPDPYGDFRTITVPIKRAGNLIVVEAQLDTMEGNFILDTGAPGLVLNQTYFRDAPHITDREASGVNGVAANNFSTVVRNFSILDLHYDRITADVTDLSSIENSKGIKILGLLGTRLFSKLALTIDLFNSVLYIHKLDDKGEIIPGERVFNQPDMKTSFRMINEAMFIKGSVDNHNLWLVFDTGAESNLLDRDRFKKLSKNMQVLARTTTTGIGGKGGEDSYVIFDQLVIGNYLFRRNRILLTRLGNISNAYDSSVDAILGYDFFGRGIVTINFVKKELEMYIYTYQAK
jgi:hypothetical protein